MPLRRPRPHRRYGLRGGRRGGADQRVEHALLRHQVRLAIDEADIILNEQGVPVDVRVRERGEAEKLIEEHNQNSDTPINVKGVFIVFPFVFVNSVPSQAEKEHAFIKRNQVLAELAKIEEEIKGKEEKVNE